jgi:hypothetical protein
MSSQKLSLDEHQENGENDGVQSMTATGSVNQNSNDTTKLHKTTIDTGFERQITQDSMETGPTSSVELAQRLQQMTVSPERKRDETPPAERGNDELFMKVDNNGMRQIESPTIELSSLTAGLQHTPNSYSRYHNRETPPKRRSPAFALRATPTRHFDLTPVTRNTSNGDAYLDDYSDEDDYFVITPDDTAGVLHGEHLALPTDLSPDVSFVIPGVSSIPKQLPERRSIAPPLPPLRACSKQRTKSVGTLDSVIQTACYQMEDATGVENFDYRNEMMNPIDFPERQVYSFTSRKQFEQQQRKQLTPEMMVASSSAASTRGLTPYQPSRGDLQDVGALPEEELNRIFTTRKRENLSEFISNSEQSNSALFATIPLDERQWSIPSIRLAHHLNESTTSNTECTDEEDDLRLDEDEESLTSRGSSLYLPDEAALMNGSESGVRHAPPRVVPLLPNSFQPILTGPAIAALENGFFLEHLRQLQEEDADDSNDAVDRRARHRRKKRSKKERSAVEWLRTVEASDDVFAEAASSKFLTGANLPFRSYGTSQLTAAASSPCRRTVPPNEAVSECNVSLSASQSQSSTSA